MCVCVSNFKLLLSPFRCLTESKKSQGQNDCRKWLPTWEKLRNVQNNDIRAIPEKFYNQPFKFLNTEMPSDIFCTFLNFQTQLMILMLKCTGNEAKRINKLPCDKAWNLADHLRQSFCP